ncbi:hypothetical protein [uncultured Sphingomonas sp.]|mgnify:CR=1 FL=1|uniref:hypothetical protein n=1 Tax=uncultured Sphingomonas sp. TaxID=158754 RepID=UPI0025FBFF76|nr:hypothetical protein [uncultured Sphingomonas sp.]
MALPRPAKPAALMADVRAFFAGEQRHKLLIAMLAVIMPALIVYLFVLDARSGILPTGPQITYVSDWTDARTDGEIIAQQKVDQKIKDKADAEKRAAYQRLAKQLGIE